MPVISYIDAVTMAMREEMERDSRVFVLGEDVGKKVGSLKPLMVYTTNSVKTGSSIPRSQNLQSQELELEPPCMGFGR